MHTQLNKLWSSAGFTVDSDLMIDQLRAIDNQRLCKKGGTQILKRIAQAEVGVMAKVEESLKAVLDLS